MGLKPVFVPKSLGILVALSQIDNLGSLSIFATRGEIDAKKPPE